MRGAAGKMTPWRLIHTDRFLIQLIIIVSVMAGAYEMGDWLQKRGMLPFGFRYQALGQGLIEKGHLNKIQKTELEKILRKIPLPRRVVFSSEIYAVKTGHIFLHVTRPECIAMAVDGKAIEIGTRKFFVPLVLKKGFNLITFRYTLPALNPADLNIAFSDNATLLPFPFFRLVRPGKPFSFPKIAFYLIRIIDIGRTLIFSLIMFCIVLRLPGFFRRRREFEAPPAVSLFQLLLRSAIMIFSLYNISVFCFYILKVHIPLDFIIWASIILGLFFLFLDLKKSALTWAWNWKKAGVCLGISLIVLLHVWASSGSFLPLEPIGYGDFNSHHRMIRSIQLQGRFWDEEDCRIYPQSIHAAIVSGAKVLGLQPEEWVTPFLMLMAVLLLLSIYLVGNELFPGIPLYLWGIALAVSNFMFIFQSMFSYYRFPAIIAVALFLLALFFLLRKSLISASLALAASLAVYPYFAPAFLSGVVILYFWLEPPGRIREWFRLAAGLVPSLTVMGVYIAVYLDYGFTQQKECFVAAYILNPFLSLRFWNTALIFLAIVFCFRLKNPKPALGVFSAISCGFLCNYVPYALFNTKSTYYVMKNMLLLIAVGMIYAAAGLFFLLRKFKDRKWFLPAILSFTLLASILSHWPGAVKLTPSVALGTTAVNRWLLQNTPRTDSILLAIENKDQLQFFHQTLGVQRKLVRAPAGSTVFPAAASWLVIDRSAAAAFAQSPSLEKEAEFSGFCIFRLKKNNPDPLRN